MKKGLYTRLVEGILRDYPKSRNSDRVLMGVAMQIYGIELTNEQKQILMCMPSLETLTRARRDIQSSGKYPADKKIQDERKFKSFRMQQNMPKGDADTAGRIIDNNTELS